MFVCILLCSLSQANFNALRQYCATQFGIISRNMTRYSSIPVRPLHGRPLHAGGPGWRRNVQVEERLEAPRQQQPLQLRAHQEGADPLAKLGKPKNLLQLWHEYLFGLNGNKPAKDFTTVERGKCRFVYSRRKSFWDVMIQLINQGLDELTAIDRIRQCYGHSVSVTDITKALTTAKRTGFHVNLGLQPQQQANRGSRHHIRQHPPRVAAARRPPNPQPRPRNPTNPPPPNPRPPNPPPLRGRVPTARDIRAAATAAERRRLGALRRSMLAEARRRSDEAALESVIGNAQEQAAYRRAEELRLSRRRRVIEESDSSDDNQSTVAL